MVELEGVSYRAGGTLILRDVSVAFVPGAFNVILGPNGAGKTTLLKLAVGHVRPSRGRVRYDGRAVEEIGAEALALRRAVLSQHVELAFALPVRSVVMMGRYPHFGRVPSARDREIVQAALELVGMEGKAAQSYPTLSGGEQQKVQLARVMAQIWNYDDPSEAKVLFLDEPTTSLDIHFRIQLLDTVRALLDVNCTVVAILHDLNTAFDYGDAFFLLDGGRLV
ncbi:MAG TPA: ATP-binding cassette domain-containing protein, partial [Gemmatimonadota bacterium]|nr:ATP-binding cassette domain-containing protein [Gemmatimonadota bacterium]